MAGHSGRLAALLFGALCTCAASHAAQEATIAVASSVPSNRVFAVLRDDIRVDGDLSDWKWRGGVLAIDTSTGWLNPGPVASDKDSSALVQFAWNGKDRLFAAARVKDQSLVPLSSPDAMPWTCDSLILSLSTFGATRDSDRFHQVKTVSTAAEPFFGFSYYTNRTAPRSWTPNSSYCVRRTRDGYDVEASIALPDIGYAPRSGDRVKVAFILSDKDADGKFSQILKGQTRDGGVATWIDLRFRDESAYAGTIVPVQRRYRAGSDLAFVGDVDVFAGGVRITGLRVKDEARSPVATVACDVPVTAGQCAQFSAVLPAPNLKAGAYEADLVTSVSGRESNGAVHETFEVIASGEAEMGSAGKLPDRYIVPDPYRFAFPSDASRYQTKTVTRADYIAVVKRVLDFEKTIYAPGRAANASQHGPAYALPAYVLFKAAGDTNMLAAALGFMKSGHEAHAKGNFTPFLGYLDKLANLYLSDPAVPEADKVWLREFTPRLIDAVWKGGDRPREWGAFNRALIWGFFLDIAAKRFPDNPAAKEWKAYADLEWESWWPYRDHDENSSDYNASAMMDYLDWAEFRNPEYLKDPGIKRWLERELYQVTPAGGFPGYGDASPWNASCWQWIAVFERAATVTRDGRFKWAAHRLLDYATRQIDDLFSYHAVYDGAAGSCAWAWLYADDSIPEVAPEMKSRVLERKRVAKVDDAFRKEMAEKHGITGLFYKLEDAMQPDKLILRTGGDPFAPCGMLELCSDAGHHMSSVPNFNNFMHQRAVLLTDLGYYEKGPEYHNVVFIEDLTGIAPEAPAEVVTVPSLQPGSQATYAAVSVENYKGWPALNDRRVLLTHEGPTIVKDLVRFHTPFVARVRQQWQTRDISPKSGPNWANTCIPTIIQSGLGLGRGVYRWNNPNWDLLIYFTPQEGRDYEVFDRSLENIWQTVPLRVSQRYRGLPEKDKPIHFTTLLWPHKPEMDVDKYAAHIQVVEDTPAVSAFAVRLSEQRALYLGINDTGETRECGPVSTDAAAFAVVTEGADKDMKVAYVYGAGVRTLSVGGKSYHQSAERGVIDKGF